MIENFINSDVNGFVLTSDVPWMKNVLSELTSAYEAYNHNSPTTPLKIKSHMCKIFVDILDNTVFDSKPTNVETEKKKRIRTLLSYISQNYMNPVTLSELADLAGLSETECSRFFSSQMKVTPFEYLNRYRIERSCELLVTTDLSISEIGMRVGFNSFSYYGKRFREIMRCSPSEYRRKILAL